ncbi:sugar phosphate isomerase [Alicyclobacillus fastidiosus]|nr:sugar phosphate isomerase [Alicyclobacillus fastidiosus]
MKIGLSTYSFFQALNKQEMNVLEVIDWIAENGGEHVEIVPIGYTLSDNPELVDQIREREVKVGLDVSNYAIGANFIQDSHVAYEAEIERVMSEVHIANRLGVKYMRHDVAWRPILEATLEQFEQDLPRIAGACRKIADYAKQYGITTSVENHGYFVQASDRVLRLVKAVDRDNFRTTLDVGNFMCADEQSTVSVQKNLPYASVVHLKDFYVRPSYRNPGDGWFQTAGGNFLRGAIVGHGDIDMWEVIRLVKQ